MHLQDGLYDLSQAQLQLNSTDSGTPGAPITYVADGGNAMLSGGVIVPPSAVHRVVAGQHPLIQTDGVLSINLTALGITNFGQITASPGLGNCPSGSDGVPGRLEVFVNREALVLARWPNVDAKTGYWNWSNIVKVQNGTSSFSYAGSRPQQWQSEVSHLWLHGYWQFDWADSVVQVMPGKKEKRGGEGGKRLK